MRLRTTYFVLILCCFASCARYTAQESFLGLLLLPNAIVAAEEEEPVIPVTLKSLQAGTVIVAALSESIVVTPVDPASSVLFCNISTGSSDPNRLPTCRLVGNNTIMIESYSGGAATIVWRLVEFGSGVSVQRNSFFLNSGTSTNSININNINLARSFVILNGRIDTADRTRDQSRLLTPEFVNNTTISFQRDDNSEDTFFAWQVIQFGNSSVQSGTITINNGDLQTNVPISAVNTAKSFLIHKLRAASAIGGIENRFSIQGTINSPTNLLFQRKGNVETITIQYFVLELLDNSIVYSGTTGTIGPGHTGTQFDSAIGNTINPLKVIPILSASIVDSGNAVSISDQDSVSYNPSFPNNTTIRFTRLSPENPRDSSIDWFLLQFDDF